MSLRRTSGRHAAIAASASAADSTARDVGAAALEDRADETARVGLVVDDEHPHALERGLGLERRVAVDRCGLAVFFGGDRRYRNADDEGRAKTCAAAGRVDRAAVQLDEVADDRESEPEAAVLARAGRVLLAEAIEDVRQELGLDADPGIADDQQHVAAVAALGQRDAAAAGP